MKLNVVLWVLLCVAFAMANWPFLTNRRFLLFPNKTGIKSFSLRVVEWFVLYILLGFILFMVESYMGQIYKQGWEFYVITLALFATLAFPGFVLRYLFKSKLQ